MPGYVSVGTLCDQLAALARRRGLKSLTMWLELAANQAYLDELKTTAKSDGRIGVWDWDIRNNLNYSNEVNAALFGLRAEDAARGHPVEDLVTGIHADDVAYFQNGLRESTKTGGAFHAEYRVISGGSVKWLRSDGTCLLGADGRPIRMLGSVVDVTAEKPRDNVIKLKG